MNETDLPVIDELWDFGDPAATELRFRELQELVAERDYGWELRTQIARTYSLRDMFDEAHGELDAVARDLDDAPPSVHVRYLLERGRSYNSAGRQAEAVPLFLEAFLLSESEGLDYYAVDAAHMLGIALPVEEQLDWHRKGMALAEESGDARTRDWLGPLYNNMGWTLHDSGEHEEALEIFEKSLAFRESKGDPIPLRIAHWSVARALRSLGRPQQALEIQLQLLEELEAGDSRDGYVFEELGECLLALGQESEARPYFATAYSILADDAWLRRNEVERLERLRILGEVDVDSV